MASLKVPTVLVGATGGRTQKTAVTAPRISGLGMTSASATRSFERARERGLLIQSAKMRRCVAVAAVR